MPFTATKEGILPSLKNKSLEIRQAFAKAANAALSSGKTEDEAIFAGMQVVSQIERKKDQEIKKERQAEAAKPPPWHLQAIQESAEIKKQQRIQEEFQANAEFREKVAKAISEGSLIPQQDTPDCIIDIQPQGEYCQLIYSSGKRKKVKLADINIEQHASIGMIQKYFEPVTAFNNGEPEIVFTSDGEIVMQEVSSDLYL
jgi:hypothetical protein